MKIKNYLLSTAAAVMAFGVHATAPVAASAADVKACDLYGSGFYYLPGSETCLGISGRVRAIYTSSSPTRTHYTGSDSAVTEAPAADQDSTPSTAGDNAVSDDIGFSNDSRIQFDVRSESDIGTIRGVARVSGDSSGVSWNALRIHVGDNFTFGEFDDFFTRNNDYGHDAGTYDGLYGFETNKYAEFHSSAGPINFTVGIQESAADDEIDFYAGGKYTLDNIGWIAVHYVSENNEDANGMDTGDDTLGVAVRVTAIDNLALKGWYATDDEGRGSYVGGPAGNDTQWGFGGAYSMGDFAIKAGYSVAEGGTERAGTGAMGGSHVDPTVTDWTIQFDWSIASGLKAEFAYRDMEGAIEHFGANTTRTSVGNDAQDFRIRLIRSW